MRTLGRPLSPQDIRLTERIGEGQFGDVHKGVLYPDVSDYIGCYIMCGWVHLYLIFTLTNSSNVTLYCINALI